MLDSRGDRISSNINTRDRFCLLEFVRFIQCFAFLNLDCLISSPLSRFSLPIQLSDLRRSFRSSTNSGSITNEKKKERKTGINVKTSGDQKSKLSFATLKITFQDMTDPITCLRALGQYSSAIQQIESLRIRG